MVLAEHVLPIHREKPTKRFISIIYVHLWLLKSSSLFFLVVSFSLILIVIVFTRLWLCVWFFYIFRIITNTITFGKIDFMTTLTFLANFIGILIKQVSNEILYVEVPNIRYIIFIYALLSISLFVLLFIKYHTL